jgi:hypothetical protein
MWFCCVCSCCYLHTFLYEIPTEYIMRSISWLPFWSHQCHHLMDPIVINSYLLAYTPIPPYWSLLAWAKPILLSFKTSTTPVRESYILNTPHPTFAHVNQRFIISKKLPLQGFSWKHVHKKMGKSQESKLRSKQGKSPITLLLSTDIQILFDDWYILFIHMQIFANFADFINILCIDFQYVAEISVQNCAGFTISGHSIIKLW